MEKINLLSTPYGVQENELVSILAQNKNVRIEKIVSTGQVSSEWYDQSENEFVALLSGNATILFDDNTTVDLAVGDSIMINAHQKHKVIYTSDVPPCCWLCVFFKEDLI